MNYIVSKLGEDKMLEIMESKCRALAARINLKYNQKRCDELSKMMVHNNNLMISRLIGEVQAIADAMEEHNSKEIYKGKYDFKDFLVSLAKKSDHLCNV